MKKKNLIAAGLFLALAIFVWVTSGSCVPKLSARFSANQLANDFFPKLVSVLMGGLAVLLVIQTLHAKPGSPVIEESDEDKPTKKEMLMPAAGLALLVLYLVLIEPLGYVIDTFLLCVFYLALFRCKKWYYYAVTPLVASLGVYMLFTRVFLVILPRGILPL